MSVLFQYFAAESDEQAATALHFEGGPGDGAPDAFGVGRSRHGLDVFNINGIDPTVNMATLEGLLTGRDPLDIIDDEDAPDEIVAMDGDMLVVRVREQLRERLAAATSEELRAVAEPWSQTEEFGFDDDPEPYADIALQLAELSRRGKGLYCWTCM